MQGEICFHDFLTGMRTGKKVTLERLGDGFSCLELFTVKNLCKKNVRNIPHDL